MSEEAAKLVEDARVAAYAFGEQACKDAPHMTDEVAEEKRNADAADGALLSYIERIERERDEEKAIVDRIWDMLGRPSYEELAGRSIYDLIRAKDEHADVLNAAIRKGAREGTARANDRRAICDGAATMNRRNTRDPHSIPPVVMGLLLGPMFAALVFLAGPHP